MRLAVARDFGMAAHYYERAHLLAPENAEILYDLAATVHSLGSHDRALAYYQQALALNPLLAGAYNDLGILLYEKGDFAAALDMFSAAARHDPHNATAASNLGGAFLERGRLAEARASYDRAVKLEPRNGGFLYQLAELTPAGESAALLERLLKVLKDEDTLKIEDRIGLHFALGKTHADTGQHAAAFAHYKTGNALKRSQIHYDENLALRHISEFADAFSSPLFEHLRSRARNAGAPIFVVGMPRSGSTLVEQILARHPDVGSAGEGPDFAKALDLGADGPQQPPQTARGFIEGLTGQNAGRIAAAYAAKPQQRAPGGARIIDKTLENFRFVGLIRALWPNATIIHMKRDPLDTCWSCFSKVFAGPQSFSYDLGELGRFFRGYQDVMRRWEEILPPGAVIEIQYETLVCDFERTCRHLLDLCGLTWHDQCLDFHRGETLVRTSSAAQVRERLFKHGIGRSEPFRTHLEPLITGLGAPLQSAGADAARASA